MRTIPALLRFALATLALLACIAAPDVHAKDTPDSGIKSWLTAEMLGAMRWGKAEATTSKERLEFATAERICRERLLKQIDGGSISRTSAFLIAETVRKDGKYRGEKLTRSRADEIRRSIISGKIFEGLRD